MLPRAEKLMMSSSETKSMDIRRNIDAPLWDLDTFAGRLKHFFWVTDYRTVVERRTKLEEAKVIVTQCRLGQVPAGTSEQQLRYAKKLYESAYHPDSGELQNVIGRMSFQVPGGMLITAGMLQFYRTNSAVILWQWINQSFNALVNYTNRNAASQLTNTQITVAYVSATTSALIAALGLKKYLAKSSSSLLQRFVPFIAVASANVVNIPLTRQSELINGITCFDSNGNKVTESKYAAVKGISQVVLSRIVIATPGMLVMPVIMERLEKKAWFLKYPRMHLPFQTLMLGVFLTFMVPIGCALFPQRSSISVKRLKVMDSDRYEAVVKKYDGSPPQILYFNKGL